MLLITSANNAVTKDLLKDYKFPPKSIFGLPPKKKPEAEADVHIRIFSNVTLFSLTTVGRAPEEEELEMDELD